MELPYGPQNSHVMRAAKTALKTGNANYVLIWIPEESENTLKNILEKTCCIQSINKSMQDCAIDWYFETVNRLQSANRRMVFTCLKPAGSDESPHVLKVEKAIDTGNFEEIRSVIPPAHSGEVKQRFLQVMNKKNYPVNDIAAGRAYVSAFFDFIGYVYTLTLEIPGNGDSSMKKTR